MKQEGTGLDLDAIRRAAEDRYRGHCDTCNRTSDWRLEHACRDILRILDINARLYAACEVALARHEQALDEARKGGAPKQVIEFGEREAESLRAALRQSVKSADENPQATPPGHCRLCGEPMPPGEEMFYFHGYSGPCPKPPKGETP